MTMIEAWRDLYAGDEIILKVKYWSLLNRIVFLFKPGNYSEQQFYDKVFVLTAGVESYTLEKEPKTREIRIRDHRTGEDLK